VNLPDAEKFEEVPVAVLAGGLATRLRPITHKVPKCLVEVAGRPFLDHQLDLLYANGIRRVVLCLGHLGEQVAAHLAAGYRHMDICCSFDGEKLLGTGGALRRARPLLGPTCWVLYGDSYLDFDYRAVYQAFRKHGASGLMTVLRNQGRWDRSNVLFEGNRLVAYDKKRPSPQMQHIDFGAALLRTSFLEEKPQTEAWDVADLYHDMVARGLMIGYEVSQRFYEIGSPTGLADTQAFLIEKARARLLEAG
jgi:NDP-sugar pyrophosphorylase family protein